MSAGRLELVNVKPPDLSTLREGQAVLRSTAGEICGSDRPKFLTGAKVASGVAWSRPPGYPLHEIVGEVVGSKSALLAVGDRVVGWASGSMGLAEFVVAEEQDVLKYENFGATEAVLIQP